MVGHRDSGEADAGSRICSDGTEQAGPGGILRALRTIPMFEEIAENIKNIALTHG